VTIRRATALDAPALARLRFEFRAALGDVSEPERDFVSRCTTWMADHLTHGRAWRAWVADDAHGLVGTIWLQLIEKLPNPVSEPERHGYISSLYVRPEQRGGGLGSQLLATALDECRRAGVDAVILWPTPKSRSLYLRHGFAERGDLLGRRG
jgi:GNAT superfamily N-acetyltransferase